MKNLRSFIARNVKFSESGVVKVNDRNIMGLVWLWSREILHYLGVNGWAKRQQQLLEFVRHLQHILKHNGSNFAIQRLKVSLFALYSWLGGNPLKTTQEVGQRVRLRHGLPKFLPRVALRNSKANGLLSIRLWASLLNIYKYIEGQHKAASLETIQAPPFTGSSHDFGEWVTGRKGIRYLFGRGGGHGPLPKFVYNSAYGLVIGKAGANSPLSMTSIPADAFAWTLQPINWVRKWFLMFKDEKMLNLLDNSIMEVNPRCAASPQKGCQWPDPFSCTCSPHIGRLHTIEEAAGKVRVVAICDYFTQVALKPVHDYMFQILRNLPTDATFDQQGAVDRFAAAGHTEIFSYDLKAATDLIPRILYEHVLSALLGWKTAVLWSSLLTDRYFAVSRKAFDLKPGAESMVRYTRGQPMGALSSWAGLALVHHSIVQFAAQQAGHKGWFQNYLVLGDDIVIAGEKVGKAYLDTCDRLGITISLGKTLASKDALMNFASQTLYKGRNVSPLSLREEISAQNVPMRTLLAKKILHRWEVGKTSIDLVKRVVTGPQWASISYGGLRGSGLQTLNLIRFLIDNPLNREDLTIGNVISWLGLLHPELRKLPKVLRDSLEQVLIGEIQLELEQIDLMLQNRAASAKELLDEVLGSRVEVTAKSLNPYNSKPGGRAPLPPKARVLEFFTNRNLVYLTYIRDCLMQRIWQLLMARPLLGQGNLTLDLVVRQYNAVVLPPKVKRDDTAHAFQLLAGAFRYVPEDLVPGDSPRKIEPPAWTKVREALAGPHAALSRAVLKVLGVNLPIPQLLTTGARPSLWRELKTLENTVLASWAERDRSPCMYPSDAHTQSVVLYVGPQPDMQTSDEPPNLAMDPIIVGSPA
jgi:hypothetical protein